MRNTIADRNVLIVIIVACLLIFGIYSIGYSQNSPAQVNPSPEQIQEKIQSSVVFIRSDKYQGSGVLVNDEQKIVLTNAHVTAGADTVKVFFPAYNSQGQLIQDRNFYKDSSVLGYLGYVTDGRVVAEHENTDVAMIFVKGLPKTVKPIKNDKDYDYSHLVENSDHVYILGNPVNRSDLWQLDFGVFGSYEKKDIFGLVIYVNVFSGNSGGPVVDKDGWLIGLISRGDMNTKETDVVPIKHIIDLAKTIHIGVTQLDSRWVII